MPVLLPPRTPHRDPAAPAAAHPPQRRGALVALAAVVLAGVTGLGLVRGVGDLLPDGEPFAAQEKTDSTVPLMLAAQDLRQFRGATGTFQVLVEREQSRRYVPGWVAGQTTTLAATGTVDGLVDLSALPGRVQLYDGGKRARFRLPAAVLGPARLDMANTRGVDRDRGVADRVGGALVDDPVDDRALLRDAERRIAEAAAQSDLRARTELGVRRTLTGLARAFGVTQVEVSFDPPAEPLP